MKILFDIGNVLVHVKLEPFLEALKKEVPESDPWLFLESMQGLHDTGKINMNQALYSHFKLSEEKRKSLVEIWKNTVSRCEPMLDLFNKLKKNHTLVLVSNIGQEHAEHLKEICPEFYDTDIIRHFSYQVGARKPSKLYFQSLFSEYPEWINNDNPRGLVYFDDRIENLQTVKELKSVEIDTCHFDINHHDDLEKIADLHYLLLQTHNSHRSNTIFELLAPKLLVGLEYSNRIPDKKSINSFLKIKNNSEIKKYIPYGIE